MGGLEAKCLYNRSECLGPLLFLLFINDLPNATDFLTLLFADDTTFQVSDIDPNKLFNIANSELEKASVWFSANKLTLNVKKTKFMLFSDKQFDIGNNKLQIGGTTIEQIGTYCQQKYFKYQPSGEGGARSPPATPHRLQNPKWPPGGPKMAGGVRKGVYS